MNVLAVLCAGGWMSVNLSEGWRRLGWRVHEFLYGTHMGKDWSREGRAANERVNRELIDVARQLKREGKLDLVFAVIYDDVLEVETARALRALGAPMVNYHVDLVGQWYRVLRTGRYFDRLACAHRDNWEALQRAGIRPYYMPMAANPDSPASPASFAGVLYLGSPMPFRRRMLAAIQDAGLPLRVYGNNWHVRERPAARARKDPSKAQPLRKATHDAIHYLVPRLRAEGPGPLLDSLRYRMRGIASQPAAELPPDVIRGRYGQGDFTSLVTGAAVNLGFTHFQGREGTPSERRQVRLRDFEIPMAGGFYLAQDCPQLRELFEIGSEIATWDGEADLLRKCRHYLARPEERMRMAAAARARCLAEHTWARRFGGLLDELGLAHAA